MRWESDPDFFIGCQYILDDGTVVEGADTVRFLAANPTATVGTFSRVQLRGVNSSDFWLRDEAIAQFGVWHRFLGDAVLDTQDTDGTSTVRVRNLGSSGEDGIEVIAG